MRSIFLILALAVTSASAQYRSESWVLKPGWTAIYLNVDPGIATLDILLAGNPDITDVWQWRPNGLDPSLNQTADASGTDEWKVWRRGDAANSTFLIPAPHAAYLVKLKATASAQTLSLKGKVTAPRVQWRTDGTNLVGFPIKPGTTPQLNRYLKGAGVVDDNTEAYRYVGGPLNASNPIQTPIRTINASRGQAFWIRSDKFTDFYGPIQVRVALDDGLHYGSSGSQKRVVLTNQTDAAVAVTLKVTPSEWAPGSTTAPHAPALTLRSLNEEGFYVYSPLGANHVVTVPAKDSVGLTLGLDRTGMAGFPGDQFAGLLSITDGGGYSEIFLPVTAEKASLAGLWYGEARISQVQNQLQRFQRREDGNYLVDEEGQFVPEYEKDSEGNLVLDGSGDSIPLTDSGLNATAQDFSLRLLVHVNEAGEATLLSQVHTGVISDDGEGNIVSGVSIYEGGLSPIHLGKASRFSATHLPPGLVLGFSGGPFAPNGNLTATFELGANDPSNPFLHNYHPDHDNLDARFDETLPAGIESHTVRRAITLAIREFAAPGEGPTWGSSLLSGNYSETIIGLHKQPIAIAGIFALVKISSAPVFQTP